MRSLTSRAARILVAVVAATLVLPSAARGEEWFDAYARGVRALRAGQPGHEGRCGPRSGPPEPAGRAIVPDCDELRQVLPTFAQGRHVEP